MPSNLYPLTAANPVARIHTEYPCDRLVVDNPTPNPVYVRLGGDSTPDATLYDLVIPAGSARVWGVSGSDFVCAFAGTVVAPTTDIVSGLAGQATVQALHRGESAPDISSLSYLNLSLSQTTRTLFNTSTTQNLPTVDLSVWGGLVASVKGGSGIGRLTYQVSEDAATWVDVAYLPINANIILDLALPRLARYGRLTVSKTIGLNPVIGQVFQRPCLTEVLNLAVLTAGGIMLDSVSGFGPGASFTINYYVENYPGLRLAVNPSTGVTYSVLLEASYNSSANFFTIQSIAPGATVPWSRILTQPPPYLRLTVTNTAGVGNLDYQATAHPLTAAQAAQDGERVHIVARAGDIADLTAVPVNLPVLGTVGDAAGVLTHEGQLRQLVAQTAVLPAAAAPQFAITAVGAGVWTNTGATVAAGKKARYIAAQCPVAAGGLLEVGFGTGAAVVIAGAIGAAPALAATIPGGLDYTVNTTVWVQSAVAGNINWMIVAS